MTKALPQSIIDMMKKYEKSIFFLKEKLPAVTIVQRKVQYSSYYNAEGKLEYEADLEYARDRYKVADQVLRLSRFEMRNTPQSSAYYDITAAIERYEAHGFQDHEGIETVFIMKYFNSLETQRERFFLQEEVLHDALEKSYRKLIEYENDMARTFGYISALTFMRYSSLQEVFTYHNFSEVNSYVENQHDEIEPLIRQTLEFMIEDTIAICRNKFGHHAGVYVQEYYRRYIKQTLTKEFLKSFKNLSEEEKGLPLSWTLVQHINISTCAERIVKQLKASQENAVISVRASVELKEETIRYVTNNYR